MDAERRDRLKSIFSDASELPPDLRPAFLDEVCAGDSELRAEVMRLLEMAGDTQSAVVFHLPRHHALSSGELLAGRFRIVRFVGKGGMGEVYEAKDQELHGTVALKILRPELCDDPDFLGRFRREAQLARQVTNANVCRVFDVGYDRESAGKKVFLTMEFLDGETLGSLLRRKGKLTEQLALPLIRQMAEGLSALHVQGIVHRDFKPGNVMVVRSASGIERAVITDFGLARAVHPSETGTSITQGNQMMGTPDYMAPEQLMGGLATPASDVYALGLVIYEMVAGKKPFPGGRAAEKALERAEGISPQWNAVIWRCLSSQPRDRPASVLEIIAGLEGAPQPRAMEAPAISRRRWVLAAGGVAGTAAAAVGIYRYLPLRAPDSIAVLPFTNAGGSDDESLSDGLTEGLIDGLAAAQAIRVIARSAVFRFKDIQDPLAVGRQLRVATLLVGRMKRSQELVIVTAELVDALTAQQMWSHHFTTSLSSLQRLPGDLVELVLRALGIKRRKAVQAERRQAVPEAYQAYLRGRHALNRREPNAFVKAQEWFQKAIDLDAAYAAPYAGLADVYSLQSGGRPPNEVCPKAKAAALRSLELDGSLAEGHTTLGFVQMHYDWAWTDAESSYQRAIQLNASYAPAHSYFARWLTARKRFPEAEKEQRRAMELDPLSPALGTALGVTFYHARRWESAETEIRRVLTDQPKFIQALAMLGVVRIARKDYARAIADLEKCLQLMGEDDYGVVADWSLAQALSGNADKAREGLRRVERLAGKEYVAPCFLAGPLLGLGQRERALEVLERSVDPDHSWPVFYYGVEPKLDPVRGEPRFQKLLERIGLAT